MINVNPYWQVFNNTSVFVSTSSLLFSIDKNYSLSTSGAYQQKILNANGVVFNNQKNPNDITVTINYVTYYIPAYTQTTISVSNQSSIVVNSAVSSGECDTVLYYGDYPNTQYVFNYNSSINDQTIAFENSINSQILAFDNALNSQSSAFASVINNQTTAFQTAINNEIAAFENSISLQTSALTPVRGLVSSFKQLAAGDLSKILITPPASAQQLITKSIKIWAMPNNGNSYATDDFIQITDYSNTLVCSAPVHVNTTPYSVNFPNFEIYSNDNMNVNHGAYNQLNAAHLIPLSSGGGYYVSWLGYLI